MSVPELLLCISESYVETKLDKTLDMNMNLIAQANFNRKKGTKFIDAFEKEEKAQFKEGTKEEKELLFENFKKFSK